MSEELTTMEELSEAVDASFETFHDEGDIWDKMKQYQEDKTVLTVTVDANATKGGVVAMVENVRGFIPASCLSLTHVDDLGEYLNKELEVHVIDVDRDKKRLILSAKSVLQEAAAQERAAKLAALQPGDILEGTVETLKPYGAFIRTEDGISGMIHVSQISTKRIKEPSDVLKKGDVVKAKVIGNKDGRLSLSIKALTDTGKPAREPRDRDRDDDFNFRNFKLPKSEDVTTNLGDLLKGLKLD